MNMKLVSIIVPIYNSEKTIERCIDSLKKQIYKNIEIILIDDGSADLSYDICRKMIQSDKRVFLYRKDNSGVSDTRNYGIKKSKGEFILFVDSDDVVLENYVSSFISNVKNNDIVVCGIAEKKNNDFIYNYINGNGTINNNYDIARNIISNCKSNLYNSPCNKFYKSKIIKDNDIYFEKNLDIGEDLLFNLRYLEKCHSIGLMDECNYIYIHSNEESLTSKFNASRWDIEKKLYGKYVEFFKNIGMYETFKKEINEFLIFSVNKCAYTSTKNISDYKRLRNYIKSIFYDDIFSDKEIKISSHTNKIVYFLLKFKFIDVMILFTKLKLKIK